MSKCNQQYTSIGGQAVIEGVMMRSPNSFVVAVRKSDGKIRLRTDQWYGLSKKMDIFKKPFFRGVLTLFETMANGIVSLNYSANIAMDEEMRAKAIKKGVTEEDYEREKKEKEKVSLTTFFSIAISFVFGILLFVMLPHVLTALLENSLGRTWGLESIAFHAVDGAIKGTIFLLYVYLIGFIPDIRRVFQYHGAEHMAISTFESKEELSVTNARKYKTFHPRCGTTFIFFLLFVSIIMFTGVFVIVPVGTNLPTVPRHLVAILLKILLTIPVAGISYEILKILGKNIGSSWGRLFSYPGMMLQRLTTREPDDSQLEVALASLRMVLLMEESHNLKDAKTKVIGLEEADITSLEDIRSTNLQLKDFLE